MSNLSYARCRMKGCNFKSEDKDEKVWDSHYQTEHGISIYNNCSECGKRFIAAWIGFASESEIEQDNGKVFHETICDECGQENPLEKLFVEEPEKV